MTPEQRASDLWDEYRESLWSDAVMKTKIAGQIREAIQQHVWEEALAEAWRAIEVAADRLPQRH